MTRGRILVAEDDSSMRELLGRILVEAGHEVVAVPDGLAAIARLRPGEGPPFDLVLTDMRMPGADGAQVLAHARRHFAELPVVVLTAFGSIPGAVDAMRLGAFDYLSKPLPDPQTLRAVVARALVSRPHHAGKDVTIVAEDPAMQRVVQAARQVAQADSTVLLLGESGEERSVGKYAPRTKPGRPMLQQQRRVFPGTKKHLK